MSPSPCTPAHKPKCHHHPTHPHTNQNVTITLHTRTQTKMSPSPYTPAYKPKCHYHPAHPHTNQNVTITLHTRTQTKLSLSPYTPAHILKFPFQIKQRVLSEHFFGAQLGAQLSCATIPVYITNDERQQQHGPPDGKDRPCSMGSWLTLNSEARMRICWEWERCCSY
jgi:hypothetical protein